MYTILRKYKSLKRICLWGILIFSSLLLLNYYSHKTSSITGNPIIISTHGEQNALAEGSELWIRGILVDGRFYSATQIFETGWIVEDTSIGWKQYERPNDFSNMPSEISGIVPFGSAPVLLLESNRWRGIAHISFMGNEITVDCYSPDDEGERQVTLPESTGSVKTARIEKVFFIVWSGLELILFIYLLFDLVRFLRNCQTNIMCKSTNRQTWIDLLRILSMLTIVLLHATCDAYTTTFSVPLKWYSFLYVNCLTAFAVPVFFMISGCLLIREETHFLPSLIRRLKKILLPLVSWSIVYIVVRKFYLNEDIHILTQIVKIAFEPQYGHLWFIYTLCGVYLLSPVISWIYYKAPKNLLIYGTIVFGILPLLLRTFESLAAYSFGVSMIYTFFPEIFLFILGKWITDSGKKIFEKWYLWAAGSFFGLCMLIVITYYLSLRQNMPVKTLFSNYGTLPIFIMYISVFCVFWSIRQILERFNVRLKKWISTIADSCMTIYFSHMLFYIFLNGKRIGNIELSHQSQNMGIAIFTASLCFSLSLLIALLLKKINGWIFKKKGGKYSA